MGVKISESYLKYVKSSIRKVFTKPVEELKLMKKTLHHIIQNEGEDTEVRIKAINQLQSVDSQMLSYHSKLPQIMGIVTTTAEKENNSNNINDNSTMIVMKHDAASNDCKCDRCTDLERRF
jgi:hypothetical protein